jgi:hypothetical protein
VVKAANSLCVIELPYPAAVPARAAIVHAPAAYYVSTVATLGHPVFDGTGEAEHFLQVLEAVRTVFQARVHAYALLPAELHLVVQVRDHQDQSDATVRQRWRALTPRGVPTAARLRARLASLSGFMQTLLQRYGRERNRRRGARGRLWAARYRAALLADDTAVLAGTTWLERELGTNAVRSSQAHPPHDPVSLAAPPLRVGPGDFVCPADEAPPGCTPPQSGHRGEWLARFADAIAPEARAAHGRALRGGWALGRPESLASVMMKLKRPAGRGRERRLRDLDDELGLCGVWG